MTRQLAAVLRRLAWLEPCPAVLLASRLPSLTSCPWDGNMRFADPVTREA